jgi:hypothetical protein
MTRREKRMKRRAALIAVLLLLLLAGGALAGPFGSPQPEGKEDQFSLGVGYFHNATEWKPGGGNFGNVSIRQNQAYLQASFAGSSFSESGAAFFRVGGADFDDGQGFKDGYKPFGTVGFKDVWFDGNDLPFQLGTILQGSYCPGYKAEQTFLPGSPVSAKVKSIWDVSLGVAAQKRMSEEIRLYVGPQVFYGRAKVERIVSGRAESAMFQEKSLFGGFGGAMVSLSRGLTLTVEGQYRSRISGGISTSYTF